MKKKDGNKLLSVILTAILVLSIFASVTVVTASASDKETAISEGADWLISHQSDNGGWKPFLVSYNNALAIRAYVATGNTSSPKYALLLSKLKGLQATDGSWDEGVITTSHAVWALIDAGENLNSLPIRSAAAWLKSQQNADGGWGSAISTSLVIIALLKAGEPYSSPTIVDGVNWLKTSQNVDGWWGKTPGGPSSLGATQPYPIIALSLADSPSSPEVQQAISWLRSKLSSMSEFYYIMALEAFTVAGSEMDIQTAMNNVLSNQNSDGGWPHLSAWPNRNVATARAITALANAGYTGSAINNGMVWIDSQVTKEGVCEGDYESPGAILWSVSGLSPVNTTNASISAQKAVTLLKSIQGETGSWGWCIYSSGRVETTGLVLWSLNNYGLPTSYTTIQQGASFIIDAQNDDGGWGSHPHFVSTVHDTNHALLGLISADYTTANQSLARGLDYLTSKSENGSWRNTYATALATIILKETGYNNTLLSNSIDWLKANQNDDGGWGSAKGETSTTRSTSLALIALNHTGETGLKMARGASWLISARNEDGGWSNLPGIPCSNPSQTAQAIWALSVAHYSLQIDLNLTLDREHYYPGETVTISVSSSDEITSRNGTVTNPQGNATSISFAPPHDSTFTALYEITSDAAPGTYTVHIIAYSPDGIGTVTKNFDVLRRFSPTVSVTTDLTTYRHGDTMNITICMVNPSNTAQPVVFRWWLTIPKFNYDTTGIATMPLILPANYKECFTVPIDANYWGNASFGAIWCVGLFDTGTDEIIDYDTCGWNYLPSVTAQDTITTEEIAKEIRKRIEMVEFPH